MSDDLVIPYRTFGLPRTDPKLSKTVTFSRKWFLEKATCLPKTDSCALLVLKPGKSGRIEETQFVSPVNGVNLRVPPEVSMDLSYGLIPVQPTLQKNGW